MSEAGLRPLIHLGRRPVSGAIEIGGSDARHIGGALRMRAGDRLEAAFDDGTVSLLEIAVVERHRVQAVVVGEVQQDREPERAVTVALALLKGTKLDDLIPSLVELGVGRVVLVEAQRSVQRLDRGVARKLDRWERVVREAAQLSRRPRLPRVEGPHSLHDALSAAEGLKVLLHERASDAPLLWDALEGVEGPVSLFIGPEGGWTDEEVELARGAGAVVAYLGSRILRAQTAAVAAVALALAAAGDM